MRAAGCRHPPGATTPQRQAGHTNASDRNSSQRRLHEAPLHCRQRSIRPGETELLLHPLHRLQVGGDQATGTQYFALLLKAEVDETALRRTKLGRAELLPPGHERHCLLRLDLRYAVGLFPGPQQGRLQRPVPLQKVGSHHLHIKDFAGDAAAVKEHP